METFYGTAFGNNDPQGFTNTFLESRDQSHFFDYSYKDYDLYDTNGQKNTLYRDILKTKIERSKLSDTFLGDHNINYLKKVICDKIAQKSGGKYKIDYKAQKTEPLVEVMTSIFLDNAKHLPTNITKQVGELNFLVIQYMVPHTISKIREQLVYMRNSSQQPYVMSLPVNPSSAGTRGLDMTQTFI
jgi:hypothetical protein